MHIGKEDPLKSTVTFWSQNFYESFQQNFFQVQVIKFQNFLKSRMLQQLMQKLIP